MIYNDRVTYTIEKYDIGEFGEEIYLGKEEKTIPAHRSPLTHNQQIGYFGSYNKDAFKLHLQGIHEGIERIEYKGIPYDVNSVIHHGYSTVLIIA